MSIISNSSNKNCFVQCYTRLIIITVKPRCRCANRFLHILWDEIRDRVGPLCYVDAASTMISGALAYAAERNRLYSLQCPVTCAAGVTVGAYYITGATSPSSSVSRSQSSARRDVAACRIGYLIRPNEVINFRLLQLDFAGLIDFVSSSYVETQTGITIVSCLVTNFLRKSEAAGNVIKK